MITVLTEIRVPAAIAEQSLEVQADVLRGELDLVVLDVPVLVVLLRLRDELELVVRDQVGWKGRLGVSDDAVQRALEEG